MDMTMTICNVATSAMVKRTRAHYITRAGVEIGVASTKAFTTQLAALFLMTSAIAKEKGLLSEEEEKARLKDMRHLPEAMRAILEKKTRSKSGPLYLRRRTTLCSWDAGCIIRSP